MHTSDNIPKARIVNPSYKNICMDYHDRHMQCCEECSLSLYLLPQHNLFCDNCHSHVARALNLMRYEGSSSWNMYKLGFYTVIYGRYCR